ncbi:MAG: NADH-quinone oxidoreductase subunit C, partial [Arachnia propionica]
MTEPKDAAQPTDAVEKTASKAAKAAPKRKGMWSTGSGDTSGYGGIEREIYRPTPSQRPFGGWFDEVVDRLIELVDGVSDDMVVIDRDEMTIHLRAEHLLDAVKTLRDDAHLRFETCVSVSGVHYPEQAGAELHVVYHLLSMTHNRRLRLEVACPEEQPHVPSVVATYPMADWHERET